MASDEWRVEKGGGQIRSDQDRYDASGGKVKRFIGRVDADGAQVFDGDLPLPHGRGQGNPPPDDERLGQLQDDDGEAGLMEAIGHAGGQVAAAAEEDEVVGEEHGGVW